MNSEPHSEKQTKKAHSLHACLDLFGVLEVLPLPVPVAMVSSELREVVSTVVAPTLQTCKLKLQAGYTFGHIRAR